MTAGRGITHSERFEKARRARRCRMHGIQAWVALPTSTRRPRPPSPTTAPPTCPLHEGDGVRARLIAGEAFGLERARAHAFAAVLRALDAGAPARAPRCPTDYAERAAVRRQRARSKSTASASAPARCWCSTPGEDRRGRARGTVDADGCWAASRSGERFIEWNFVSSSKERIEQAKADWRARRMKLPDFDNQEFIPLT